MASAPNADSGPPKRQEESSQLWIANAAPSGLSLHGAPLASWYIVFGPRFDERANEPPPYPLLAPEVEIL